MKARPNHPAAQWHWAQLHGNSCVPASLATVLGRRGEERKATELRLHKGAAEDGHDLYGPQFTSLEGVRVCNFDAGNAGLNELRAELAANAWVVVQVFSSRWMDNLPAGTNPGPNGTLTIRYHCVVLVGFEGDAFLVLDPFYSADNQPLEVSDDEMLTVLTVLTGHALVVALSP